MIQSKRQRTEQNEDADEERERQKKMGVGETNLIILYIRNQHRILYIVAMDKFMQKASKTSEKK